MPGNGQLVGLLVALAIGLLVGVERERGKGEGPDRGAAGVRTFTLVALAGAVADLLGTAGIVVAGAFVVLAALASYRATRSRDPGLTTEVALLLVFLLGVLAMRQATLSAGLGVVVALLLAAKTRLHGFVKQVLSEQELHDALLLAGGAAIVLPLLPDHAIDPWHALNPRKLWLLALIVMGLNAGGHIALRTLGARKGLLLAGLAGGLVSSTATIAAMGTRMRAQPDLSRACTGAALVSNVSTIAQLALVTGTLSLPLLRSIALPLIASGLAVALSTLAYSIRAGGGGGDAAAAGTLAGRPFEFRHIMVFVAIVAAVLLVSAAALDWLGDAALPWTLAISGLADVHAAAASAAQLVAVDRVDPIVAARAIAGALAANSAVKLVVAFATGGRSFGWRLAPGVVAMVLAFVFVQYLAQD